MQNVGFFTLSLWNDWDKDVMGGWVKEELTSLKKDRLQDCEALFLVWEEDVSIFLLFIPLSLENHHYTHVLSDTNVTWPVIRHWSCSREPCFKSMMGLVSAQRGGMNKWVYKWLGQWLSEEIIELVNEQMFERASEWTAGTLSMCLTE